MAHRLAANGLQPEQLVTDLSLYPKPADWVFGAQLHFIALLRRTMIADRSVDSSLIKNRPE